METVKTVPNGLNTVGGILNVLECSEITEVKQAINKKYKIYKNFKNGKFRWIEAPNGELKILQQKLLQYLQEHLECPPYCMAGFKGQNNIKNAMAHRFMREVITTDISHCFPNTKAKYVRKFFEREFGATGEALDLLVTLTTYQGHLPTGAPTSTLLVCFAHKEIFDDIYKKMQELGANMTIYVDDITISTHGHICNWVIKYIKNSLKRHGLHIKKAKTKRFSYKYAVVTSVHISQSGKLSAPFCIGHSVVKALEEKDLTEMSITELQGIIAKTSYIQQFQPSKMTVIKSRAIKQLKRLQKINSSTKTA